ncbi:protein dispatched homolog 2 isoform X1 [Xenopus tropicalis]|uniref:Dispatched RND transporter family member 2 n=1 Tax=Xenopus tropicalis TaxID=8364 RepID=A0A803JEQ9_XENTR|nr:protein dispatched homolog 2 isoform X1 [Xenopus tropicalis]
MNKRHCIAEQTAGSSAGGTQRETPRLLVDGEHCVDYDQSSGIVQEAQHNLLQESPSFVRDKLPSSTFCHQLTLKRSNGEVAPHSGDICQNPKCCQCNHQECKTNYLTPQLPGHEERATLCSQHSSGSAPSETFHQTTECLWKPWGSEQRTGQPMQHHVVSVSDSKCLKMPQSYSQLITEWPLPVLAICLLLIIMCTLSGLLVGQMPDFSEPLMGFEPRDTEIGRKLITWGNMQTNTGYKKTLSVYPHSEKSSLDDTDLNQGNEKLFQTRRDQTRNRRMVEQEDGVEGFFCGPPEKSYSQLVFMSKTAGSLWNLQAIQSMCRMENEKIRSHPSFTEFCERSHTKECCPSWSLGNYIAVLYNRSSCMEITQSDISHTLTLLRSCAPDYHRGALTPSCIGPRSERAKHSHCAKVPEKCIRSSAVYQLLHFLLDRDFLSPQTTDYQVPSLKYSLLFLPAKKGSSMMNIYLDNLESWDLFDNYTAITGMDLGLKQQLFQHYLVLDTVYPVLAIIAIFLSIFFYLRSVFITFMIMISVIGSLLISFFLYKLIFRLTFFPFVNLIAGILLSSICANHAFVFFDLWNLSKIQHSAAGLMQWVSHTMHHFGYLMVVSCFTMGAAFYATYMSSITSVRCFAIYMGSSVLVNMIFMISWLPATIVVYERYIAVNCSYKSEEYWNSSTHKRLLLSFCQKFKGLQSTLSETSKLLFEKLLPCGVIKFRYIWICWFAALAAGGAYIACMSPKLKLPSSEMSSLQVFRLSHPFERYDAEYCHQFMFDRSEHGEGQHMPITLIWGIMPLDNSDHLNPKANGTLVTDATFTIRNAEDQNWLMELCHKVKNQSFYYSDQGKKPNICFMEDFHRWMESRQCSQTDQNLNLCCNHVTFPYKSDILLHCIKMMVREQGGDGTEVYDIGPRFDADGNLTALVLEFQTVYHYSFNYSKTKKFYNTLNQWLMNEMRNAPSGLQNGWFTSKLSLYNLQHTLNTEIMVVTSFSIAISFVVLLLTTWNVFLSLFAVAAIGGSVMVTTGLLVLLEWQLNVIESLLISAAVGLSVDFTTNYCISYHLCPHQDRLSRVAFSLKQMSCATAMGASTMFSAGIIMLPATVLAYRKLGIFIIMIKCISCGFASFFFQSLCCFFGPEMNCGQIIWPCASAFKEYPNDSRLNGTFVCGGTEKHNRIRKVQESNTDNEQYELQPLARNLSDSFDNSTCTSKLSKRPSMVSEDIQISEYKYPKLGSQQNVESEGLEANAIGHQAVFSDCPALQTSSPYRQSSFDNETEAQNESCRGCICQNMNSKNWNGSVVDHNQEEKIHCPKQPNSLISPTDSEIQSVLYSENKSIQMYEYSRCLCSMGSSFDALDSNETCLSELDQSSRLVETTSCSPDFLDVPNSPCHDERGHLNGKRDTLRLALKETVFDSASSKQACMSWKVQSSQGSDNSVVLPNSKPDMPDVWIKRSNEYNSGYIS